MKALMNQLRESAVKAILNADSPENLEALRVKYLGKKGELTAILKQMGKLSAEERPVIGQLANEVRAKLEVSPDIDPKELEKMALEAVADRLGGKEPRKVIVKAPKIVSIVPAE